MGFGKFLNVISIVLATLIILLSMSLFDLTERKAFQQKDICQCGSLLPVQNFFLQSATQRQITVDRLLM